MTCQVNPELIVAPDSPDGSLGTLAIIIKARLPDPPNLNNASSIHFWTNGDQPLQVATMRRPTEYKIEPHVHTSRCVQIETCQEVLIINYGRIKVTFFTADGEWHTERELVSGDVLILMAGGHGFEFLEPSEILEVKQGPYLGELDKRRIK